MLVISWPEGTDKKHNGQIRTQYGHIIDIAPTILEAAGVEAPAVIDGVEQMPFDGIALNYSFEKPGAADRRTVQYYEMLGNRGVCCGQQLPDTAARSFLAGSEVTCTWMIQTSAVDGAQISLDGL